MGEVLPPTRTYYTYVISRASLLEASFFSGLARGPVALSMIASYFSCLIFNSLRCNIPVSWESLLLNHLTSMPCYSLVVLYPYT